MPRPATAARRWPCTSASAGAWPTSCASRRRPPPARWPKVRADGRGAAPPAHPGRSGVRYARSGGLSIAYETFGAGDRDLVIVPGWASNLDAIWDFPPLGPVLAALGDCALPGVRQARRGHPRGHGRRAGRARHAVRLLGERGARPRARGRPPGARPPARALQLLRAAARRPGEPAGLPPELVDAFIRQIASGWGTGRISPASFGGAPTTGAARALMARWERSPCTPTMAAQIIRRNAGIDVRPLLPAVETPALVLHSSGDPLCPPALGRHVADHLPNGRYVERAAGYHLPWRGEEAWFLEPVAQLLTGRPAAGPPPTRMVATVVATAAGEEVAIFAGPSAAIASAVSAGVAAGIHTGEVERRGETVHGFAVELAGRLARLAAPGEVVVSRTVRDLTIGSELRFADRGRDGEWELFTPA